MSLELNEDDLCSITGQFQTTNISYFEFGKELKNTSFLSLCPNL